MVMRLLRMTERPRPTDAADALALAICHLWRAPAIKTRQAGQASARTAMTGGPVAGRLAAGSPVVGSPVVGSPVVGSPVVGSPVAVDPVVGGTA